MNRQDECRATQMPVRSGEDGGVKRDVLLGGRRQMAAAAGEARSMTGLPPQPAPALLPLHPCTTTHAFRPQPPCQPPPTGGTPVPASTPLPARSSPFEPFLCTAVAHGGATLCSAPRIPLFKSCSYGIPSAKPTKSTQDPGGD